MTNIEAMKLALDALEKSTIKLGAGYWTIGYDGEDVTEFVAPAIAALRQAISTAENAENKPDNLRTFEAWQQENAKYMNGADIIPWCSEAWDAGQEALRQAIENHSTTIENHSQAISEAEQVDMFIGFDATLKEAMKNDPLYQMGYDAAKAEQAKQEPVACDEWDERAFARIKRHFAEPPKTEQSLEDCPMCGEGKLYERTMYVCRGCDSELADARLIDKNVAAYKQAEQEPDCVVHNADTPGHFAIITPALPAGTKLYTAPPKAEQEPIVMWWDGKKPFNPFTSAPQREWVSLTDDEIEFARIARETGLAVVKCTESDGWDRIETTADFNHLGDFARAIEAKLKEKNT